MSSTSGVLCLSAPVRNARGSIFEVPSSCHLALGSPEPTDHLRGGEIANHVTSTFEILMIRSAIHDDDISQLVRANASKFCDACSAVYQNNVVALSSFT